MCIGSKKHMRDLVDAGGTGERCLGDSVQGPPENLPFLYTGKGYLRRLIRVGRGWIFVLWIYLNVGWRFWRWRLQLWFQQSHSAESTYTGMKQTLLLIRHGQT